MKVSLACSLFVTRSPVSPIMQKMINISIMKSLQSTSQIQQLNIVYCIIKLQASNTRCGEKIEMHAMLELHVRILNISFADYHR